MVTFQYFPVDLLMKNGDFPYLRWFTRGTPGTHTSSNLFVPGVGVHPQDVKARHLCSGNGLLLLLPPAGAIEKAKAPPEDQD